MTTQNPRAGRTTGSTLGRMLSAAAMTSLALLLVIQPTAAQAEINDISPPADGCLDAVSAAVAFSETSSTQTTALTASGPVLQVMVEWAGIWTSPPLDPTIGIEVTGPGGTLFDTYPGTESTDATGMPGDPISYGYVADITALFSGGAPGTYTVAVIPPTDGVSGAENTWWGATITAVYDSSPCTETSTALWKTGVDFFFGDNATSSPTTDLLVYDWGYPLPTDFNATFRLSQGGADHSAATCRATSVWVATGTGVAPGSSDDLVDDLGVPNSAYGGVEGVVNPFAPPNQPCGAPAITFPVVSFTGGAVWAEWGHAGFEMLLPAGTTWAAVQLESPVDNGAGPGLPEDGAWAGGGLLLLPAEVQPPPPGPPAAPAAPTDTLPATGADASGATVTIAVVTVLAGALLMVFVRRRRHTHR